MLEIFLEFFFGLLSVSGAKKTGVKFRPVYVSAITVWLGVLFTLTLIFG